MVTTVTIQPDTPLNTSSINNNNANTNVSVVLVAIPSRTASNLVVWVKTPIHLRQAPWVAKVAKVPTIGHRQLLRQLQKALR